MITFTGLICSDVKILSVVAGNLFLSCQ